MYQTKVSGHQLFEVHSEGYGESITSFGATSQGETPVSLVNIALASCVAMCVQGYYARQGGATTVPVEVSSKLDDQQVLLEIGLPYQPTPQEREALLAYVDQKCRVKALLRDQLAYQFQFFLIGKA